MSRPDSRVLNPHEWLRYARSDLAFASLDVGPGMLLETMGFHAQQAAEKAIKAVLVHASGTEPPRTHDIGYLLLQVAPSDRPDRPEDIARLTRFAVTFRYPDDIGEMEEEERDEAVALARAAVAWAESVIGA